MNLGELTFLRRKKKKDDSSFSRKRGAFYLLFGWFCFVCLSETGLTRKMLPHLSSLTFTGSLREKAAQTEVPNKIEISSKRCSLFVY